MKKSLLFIALISAVFFTSCKDDATLSPAEKSAIVGSIKDQVVNSIVGVSDDSGTRSASMLRTTYRDTLSMEYMVIPGPQGGNISMAGEYIFEEIYDDYTEETESFYIYMDYTNTYNGFTYTEDGIQIELNGALAVTATCSMTDLDSYYPIMSYNMTIVGTVNAETSNGFDGDIVFNLTCAIDATGHGSITGTVDGEAYNEAF